MMLGLLVGTLIGAFAAFARAKIGLIAFTAFILVVIAAARRGHPLGRGLLIIAGLQTSYLLVAYAHEYLQERARRRAVQTAIGQELKTTREAPTVLPQKIANLVKALAR
jgi:hypothetical protein